ncbi:hypothetical protein ANCDUO_23707 [Ancylostoma duodenale]|uniref:Uncharacterized protein n=1 Tax=Ancylostoma duodenale TaxID=51022 RepID=A0A0C2BR33_9BILA|nr:hypothetical protein ANCDUO_23707 [Ancylostoma duodenale]
MDAALTKRISHSSKLLSISFNECMYWDENKSVNVILFDRVNRRPVERKVMSDAFFTFHHANAFEKDGFIVVDYCKYDNPGNFDDLLLEHMRSGSFIAKSIPSTMGYEAAGGRGA